MEEKVIYKEKQSMFWFHMLLIAIWLFIFYSYYTKMGDNPVTLPILMLFAGIFIVLIILFWNLKIEISEEKITAVFGVGIFRQTMLLDEIDFSSIETFKVPYLYGIGVRITPKGTLYNTRFGNAIRMQSKEKKKIFFVGTKNGEEIKKQLKRLS